MLGKRKRTSSATCRDKRETNRGRKRRSGNRAKNKMADTGHQSVRVQHIGKVRTTEESLNARLSNDVKFEIIIF